MIFNENGEIINESKNIVSKNTKHTYDKSIWSDAEKQFNVLIKDNIKLFLKSNNGGYPNKNTIAVNGDKYEVRVFLSLDRNDKNYCIEKPLKYFLEKTKSKIIPIALDSGDNYYCVNNKTGKVYYWSAENDTYYLISNNLESFAQLFI